VPDEQTTMIASGAQIAFVKHPDPCKGQPKRPCGERRVRIELRQFDVAEDERA